MPKGFATSALGPSRRCEPPAVAAGFGEHPPARGALRTVDDRHALAHVRNRSKSRGGGPRSSVAQSDPNLPRPHSALILAARITLAHFSVSSAMSLPNSAGELGNTAAPRSARRALKPGSARAALISRLSLSMISAGVFLGTPMPCPPH